MQRGLAPKDTAYYRSLNIAAAGASRQSISGSWTISSWIDVNRGTYFNCFWHYLPHSRFTLSLQLVHCLKYPFCWLRFITHITKPLMWKHNCFGCCTILIAYIPNTSSVQCVDFRRIFILGIWCWCWVWKFCSYRVLMYKVIITHSKITIF